MARAVGTERTEEAPALEEGRGGPAAGLVVGGAAPTPARVLALQRAAGNRAVVAQLRPARGKLQRFAIEGPLNIGQPVHEVLTLVAIERARNARLAAGASLGPLLSDVKTKGFPKLGDEEGHNIWTNFLHSSAVPFVRGVMWADDPEGLLFEDPQAMMFSTGALWFSKFKGNIGMTGRSHHGDLQFFHSMATEAGQSAATTKGMILDWARFLCDVITGVIPGSTKLKDNALTAKLFPGWWIGRWTIKELFGYARFSDTNLRKKAVGVLFHLIQDSFAHGHAERNAAGEVAEFHSYTEQSHKEHGKYDEWAEGKDLGERISKTKGAASAIEHCAHVLAMLDGGEPTANVVDYLDTVVFKLAPAPSTAGAGAGLEKKKK